MKLWTNRKNIIFLLLSAAFLLLNPVIIFAISLPIPLITVPETSYNFSAVPEGRVVSHQFVIGNKGGEPLEIIEVETS